MNNRNITREDLDYWSGDNSEELIETLLLILNGEQTIEEAIQDILDTVQY